MMRAAIAAVACVVVALAAAHLHAQMPDLRQMSGVPLPASDLPAGTVSVRVIRGNFANNLAGVPVEFLVDGKTTTLNTDAQGRAQFSGLKPGSRVKASATVDGERLESQEVTIEQTGFRFVLAALDPDAAARAADEQRQAAGPATGGAVVLGPGSRVIAEFSNDQLLIFYVLSILNTARTPVDIGGPLIVEMPTGARGTSLIEDSSPQASANGPRVIVTGPFKPGTTQVNVRFELPYSGPTAVLEQRWPAPLQQLQFFALKTGQMGATSPQFSSTQSATEQGQPLIIATGPAIAAGTPLRIEITGLPHHARWPRIVALVAAGAIACLGLWAAFAPGTRRARPLAA
ncbi:MAG: hypothetical protein IT184_00950 [Acidobacteria bacterium]|nr:hypothetical protein [Acidobacteriota bacterium]